MDHMFQRAWEQVKTDLAAAGKTAWSAVFNAALNTRAWVVQGIELLI